MAVEVKHAIRTAAAWTANQAAMEAIYGVGGYYTTLSAWEAAQARDLVAANEVAIAECYNDWPSGLVDTLSISAAWTTNPANLVIVRTPATERHNGLLGTGFRITNDYSPVQVVKALVHSIIEGIEIVNVGDFSYGPVMTGHASALVDKCLISTSGPNMTGADIASGEIRNSVIIGNNISVYLSGSWSAARNCTCWSNNIGVLVEGYRGNITVENTVVLNAINSFITPGTSQYISLRNNAAHDGATNAPPGGAPLLVNIVPSDFTDYANNDYSVAAASQLIDAGTTLTEFTDDINGTVRG